MFQQNTKNTSINAYLVKTQVPGQQPSPDNRKLADQIAHNHSAKI